MPLLIRFHLSREASPSGAKSSSNHSFLPTLPRIRDVSTVRPPRPRAAGPDHPPHLFFNE
jgi:hypothetical protein